MIRENLFNLLPAKASLLLTGLLLLSLNGQAFAAISKPEAAAPAASATTAISVPTSAASDTSAILNQASLIAFEGAKTLEAFQKTLSGDKKATSQLQESEFAQNFVKSFSYDPKRTALPSDSEVMDEPWQVSSISGTDDLNEDGLVIPHIGRDDDDDTPSSTKKGIDIDGTASVKKFFQFLKPVQSAIITSPFGFRWGRPHQGIDMGAPAGTAVEAAEAGKVVYSGWKQGYGNFIAIDHGHGIVTHYAHCSKLLAHTGEQVSKGDIIAKVGSTGHSTGPHLHFEVVANGVHINPLKYINHSITIVQATH